MSHAWQDAAGRLAANAGLARILASAMTHQRWPTLDLVTSTDDLPFRKDLEPKNGFLSEVLSFLFLVRECMAASCLPGKSALLMGTGSSGGGGCNAWNFARLGRSVCQACMGCS